MDHLLAKPKLTSPAANKEFLSQYLKVHVQNGLTSPKKAIEIIVSELGCKISQTTASEALGIAISKLTYDVNKGYNHLTEYVRITNASGGLAKLTTIPFEFDRNFDNDNESEAVNEVPLNSFNKIFISLLYQRSVGRYASFVSFDASHRKGKSKGMIMAASTQDLNGDTKKETDGQVTILAHAIVPAEDYENWLYFLNCFKEAFPNMMAKFFISDRDKGLIKAIKEVFPEIPHSKCLRHLSENFKKKFHSQEMTDILKIMALAFKPEDFSSHMQVIKDNEMGDEMERWIAENEPETWVRSKMSFNRFGISNSNSIEIVFSAIKEMRYLPTLDFLLSMETYICENIFKKHLFALTLQDKSLLPRIQAKLNTEIEQSVYYRIQRTGYNTAVVTGTTIVRKYSVDTENYFCSCGQYQEKGYPCTHAAAFLISVGKNPQEFCHKICYGEYQKRMFNISGNYRPTVLADLIGVQTTSNTYKLI